MFTLKITFHDSIALCKKLGLDITHNIFTLYVKLHVFREIIRAVHLSVMSGCDVSTVCARDQPVLWRGWAYRGEWSWTGWGGRCPVRRLFPSTRSSGLNKRKNVAQYVKYQLMLTHTIPGAGLLKLTDKYCLECTVLYQFNRQVILDFCTLYLIVIIYDNNYFQKEPNKVTLHPMFNL